MMKIGLYAAGIILGWAWSVTAAPDEEGQKRPKKKKAPASCVWSVKGEKNTVYLAGSIHLLRRKDLPLPAAFDHAYEDSDRLIFELSLEDAESPEASALSMKLGSYGEGKTVKDEISKEAYAKLSAYLKDEGMPEGAMDGFRPWMTMMTVTMLEMMKLGALPEFGVEKIVGVRAKEDGKSIGGLETLKDQLGLFADLGPDVQEKMLLETLAERATLAEEFPKMVAAWKKGDLKNFMAIAFDSLDDPEAKKFFEKILYERNRNWVKPIEKALSEEKNVLVVVGAGHLMGKGSVIDLLRKKGHEIRRVRVPAKGKDAEPKPAPKKDKPKRDLVPVRVSTGA